MCSLPRLPSALFTRFVASSSVALPVGRMTMRYRIAGKNISRREVTTLWLLSIVTSASHRRPEFLNRTESILTFSETFESLEEGLSMIAIETKRFRQLFTENTLRSCQLFGGLPAADISAIAAFATPMHLVRGEYLFREGSPSGGFYIVQ